MMEEQWKPIAAVPGHSVSDQGRFRNDKTGLIRKTQRGAKNHRTIVFYLHRKWTAYNAARLVALAFLGLPPHHNNRVVHRDGDVTNNAASNLEWKRSADINHDSGSGAQRKLTPTQAAFIRAEYAKGNTTQRALAERFGVVQSTISKLVTGGAWKEYFQ